MLTIDDYILGNEALHARFRLALQVIGKIVAHAPDPVTIGQLEEWTGSSARELVRLCGRLTSAGLVARSGGSVGGWALDCHPGIVTLEDVLRCLLGEQSQGARTSCPDEDGEIRANHDLDLLLMQLALTINQGLFKHLRQFTLVRLQVSLKGIFPPRKRNIPGQRMQQGADVNDMIEAA